MNIDSESPSVRRPRAGFAPLVLVTGLFVLMTLWAGPTFSAEPELDLGGIVEKQVMVPMRDGVHLSTWLYTPQGEGPWPVIYEQRYADIRSDRTRLESAAFASHGYVVAVQNFRGTHDSEGVYMAYRALGLGEQKDGYDTVEWLAAQPWCTGKIGSYGASQGGYAQNFLAASQPPHLVAQHMVDFGASLFHHGYRPGGAARPQRFEQMISFARYEEEGRAHLRGQFEHPTYDEYWQLVDTMRHFDRMDRPSFLVGSWFDPVVKGVVATFEGRREQHPGRQQMILGPWVHGRYNKDTNTVGELTFPDNARFDVIGHMARWFGHYLKDQPTGVENDPAVRYYTMGACGEDDAPGNEWHATDQWPPQSSPSPQYLVADGALGADKARLAVGSKTTWTSDPNNPAAIVGRQWVGGQDMRPYESHADVRTFTGPELAAPVEWTGPVKAKLFVTSTAKDTDFIVRVCDVYPDGRSVLLMDNVLRARFRKGFDREVFLTPGSVETLEFDVGWTSYVFNRGHRVRVTVASTGAPYYEINPQTGKPLTIEPPAEVFVAENAVLHDPGYASCIIAPVAP